VFAFFAAGVAVTGGSNLLLEPIAWGVVAGLVLGKPIGITLTALLVGRLTGAGLGVRLRELAGVACLGGVGFTVALLIAELSFDDAAAADAARLAVMAASVLASLVAAAFLVRRPSPKSKRA
jgi:NhaA family Na+:H+ antiporter